MGKELVEYLLIMEGSALGFEEELTLFDIPAGKKGHHLQRIFSNEMNWTYFLNVMVVFSPSDSSLKPLRQEPMGLVKMTVGSFDSRRAI
jgi:hypothetical protein